MHATRLCLGAVKLVRKPSDISATARSWTDGRLASLCGKTVMTLHLVTFTCSLLAMLFCRFCSCVGLYGTVINLFSTTNLRVRTRTVCPRYTELPRPRHRALVEQSPRGSKCVQLNNMMSVSVKGHRESAKGFKKAGLFTAE
eukprot:6210151-Pleurochrysis_carterae.AAC.2